MARPDAAFQAIFNWQNPVLGEEGFFVWRQANGMRRWDVVKVRDGEPITGSFSIEAGFPPGVILGNPVLGCLWGTGNFPAGHVMLGCGSASPLVFAPVEDTLFSTIDSVLKDRTIAGRSASCYSFTHPKYTLGAFCLDSSQGIPLLFTTESLTDSRFSQSMEAISVSTAEPELAIPFGLEADPIQGFPDFEDVVPVSELQLPDLSEFVE